MVAVFAKCFGNGFPADETIGLKDAGDRLQEYFGQHMSVVWGDVAKYVWAVGLLASGQASTATGTYAGQFVMGGFLDLRLAPWKRVLLTRTFALMPAVVTAILARNTLDAFDQWLNVLQSILLPFALLPVLKFTSDSRIMGTFTTGMVWRVITWVCGLLVIGINGYLVEDFVATTLSHTPLMWTILVVLCVGYLYFVAYLALGPERSSHIWQRVRACFGRGVGKCAPASERATSKRAEPDERSQLLQQPDD